MFTSELGGVFTGTLKRSNVTFQALLKSKLPPLLPFLWRQLSLILQLWRADCPKEMTSASPPPPRECPNFIPRLHRSRRGRPPSQKSPAPPSKRSHGWNSVSPFVTQFRVFTPKSHSPPKKNQKSHQSGYSFLGSNLPGWLKVCQLTRSSTGSSQTLIPLGAGLLPARLLTVRPVTITPRPPMVKAEAAVTTATTQAKEEAGPEAPEEEPEREDMERNQQIAAEHNYCRPLP